MFKIQVWDITTKTAQYSFVHKESIHALDVSKDGRLLASGDGCGTTKLWNMERGVKKKELKTVDARINCVKISPDSCFVAAGGNRGSACVWGLKRKNAQKRTLHHGGEVESIAFSSNGKYLVTGGGDSLRLWDLDADECHSEIENSRHGFKFLSVCMTPDDRWIAAASMDGSIRFWDYTMGKSHYIFNAHKNAIRSIAFSPHGGYFATASDDGTVRIWSYEGRSLRHKLDSVCSAAFSSDSKYLVTAAKHTLKLWEMDTGVCLSDIRDDELVFLSVSMTPDDRWIATTLNDGSIRFWDRTTGKSHCIFHAHRCYIIDEIVFSPHGGYFATASDSGIVRIWSYGPHRTP
ncbi:uncharacterized protein TRIVIDRAFT_152376 [Trichoderma virens Gv29-8]|uniref:Uncharacterized protein n=1 Tax=Hypocrea virens (strain Gv29-8 / FGSC 10586) TaxID=413071 RepID=G9MVL5_HYPVG|nr:uncharacterized protein TRIVIDRAFT_152376 [Trichoderma virens Gv29-8]EHK21513.1 hypothetical protein TRIVIDRAFT_152376 [Trichoderma virens Gv29-8]